MSCHLHTENMGTWSLEPQWQTRDLSQTQVCRQVNPAQVLSVVHKRQRQCCAGYGGLMGRLLGQAESRHQELPAKS